MTSQRIPPSNDKYIDDISKFYNRVQGQPSVFDNGKNYVSKYSFYYDDRKNPTYFQKDYPVTVIAPWQGIKGEKTFMNEIKRISDPKVLTYRDIKLLDEPPEEKEEKTSKHPLDWRMELFNEGKKEYKQKITVGLFIVLIIFMLLWSVME